MHTVISIIRWFIKLAFKIILLPVFIGLMLLEFVCNVAVSFLRMFFDLAGGIFILTGILSYYFQLESASEMWRLIVIGTGLCIIPMVGDSLTTLIGYLSLLTQKWLMV